LNIIRNSGHFWAVRAENVSKVFDAGVGDAHRRRNTGWKNQVGEGERERESKYSLEQGKSVGERT